jgi:hypothetical protein
MCVDAGVWELCLLNIADIGYLNESCQKGPFSSSPYKHTHTHTHTHMYGDLLIHKGQSQTCKEQKQSIYCENRMWQRKRF